MPTQTLTHAEKENRWRSRMACVIGTQVEVRYEFRTGQPQIAEVVDLHKNGCGLNLPAPLETGASVILAGLAPAGATRRIAARVVWCRFNPGRSYRAGIAFFQPLELNETLAGHTGNPALNADNQPRDYYEDLEISSAASEEAVHYMYQLLEHRYRPENSHTADAAKLVRVRKAHEVLSVPADRAAYDHQRAAAAQTKAALATRGGAGSADTAARTAREKSKRSDLLALLYTRRMESPLKPGLTFSEVEAAMGLMKEDVDFAYWYLQESGLAVPDHGHSRFSISVKGVDTFERLLDQLGSSEHRDRIEG